MIKKNLNDDTKSEMNYNSVSGVSGKDYSDDDISKPPSNKSAKSDMSFSPINF